MPDTNNQKRNIINGQVAQRVLIYALCLAVGGAWAFMSSRASNDDVKEVKQQQARTVEETNKRLKTLETNSVKVCQFLDRMDKRSGGPGLDCKDPG